VDPATVTLSGDTVDNNQATGGFGYDNNFVAPAAFGGGFYVAGGSVTLCNLTVQYNSANPDPFTNLAFGRGGGIYIHSKATVYIDSFTVAHTINNTDSSGLNGSTANIDGTYILRNC
jgi:hypothetical protein